MRQVGPHHLGQLVGLALQAEGLALDLFVVLELELEEPHHLHGRAGRPGDGDPAVGVGRVDLFQRAVGDRRPGGGPPVAGHDHAVAVAHGADRRAVGHLEAGAVRAYAPGRHSRGRTGECRPLPAPGSLPGKGPRPSRRSTSWKLGPGSWPGGNMGRVISAY